MKIFKNLIFLILLILLTGLCSCDKTRDNARNDRDTLIIAISIEPNRINPILVSDSISFAVSSLIYRGLTKIDRHRKVIPDLSESWQISKDGKEITFHLRKDVKWHDGSPFTVDDVIATFNVIRATSHSPHSESFSSILSIHAIDKSTLKVSYKKPFATALESWSIGIMPREVLNNYDFKKSDKEGLHIGTGAYKLKKWQSGEAIYFEANDKYYHNEKPIKHLILKVIPDETTQMMELKAGNIDAMELTSQQSIYESQNEEFKKRFNIYKIPSHRWGFLGFNLNDTRFKDIRVRQAISHAIDKQSIINGVFKGTASISTGPYPPEAWYYNPKAPYFEFSQEKALKLFSEAGWHKDKSGILKKAETPFEIELAINSENKDNIKIAQIIQQNLKDIGINLKIQMYEWQTFRHKIIEERGFQAILLSRVYLSDPDIYPLWHSREAKKGGWNILSYNDNELDIMLEKARTLTEINQRRDIYHNIHKRLAEQQACIFLYNLGLNYAIRKNITSVEISHNGIFEDINKWKK
ncbi:MAG: ABC transporter substrate-binding protein [Thermodesulfovibrionales bacterium]|nr:ABC transporter substrate-binding protein [Thermodesulfovibrionales bacterium]